MKPIKLFAVFFLVLTTHPAFCQHAFGIKANAGISSIPHKWEGYMASSNSNAAEIKNTVRPSFQAGAFYKYRVKEKFSLGSEILFLAVNGKEYENAEGGGDLYKHIYYVGFPVYFGYKINRFAFSLGMQANFTLAGKAESYDKYGHVFKTNKLNIRAYDLGLRSGVLCQLTKKLAVEINGYYGIVNIVGDSRGRESISWKVRQVTLGVRYTLFSNDKKKKK